MSEETNTKDVTEELTAVLEEVVQTEPEKPKKGEIVTPLNDTDFMVGSRQYKLVANHREGFDAEKLGERYSEVLARYDYIVGDWGYEQLRLKGFFETSDRKAAADQRIDTLEDYLYEFCNFGCAYFVIQRTGGKKEKINNRRRRKKPMTTTNTNNKPESNAHIAEKKEDLNKRKNRKPVIKKKEVKNDVSKKTDNQKKATNSQPKTGKKAGFTIRKRED